MHHHERHAFIGLPLSYLSDNHATITLSRVRRVLKQLSYPRDHQIDFKEFHELNDRFPAAYSPMFNLQNAIRKKVRVRVRSRPEDVMYPCVRSYKIGLAM